LSRRKNLKRAETISVLTLEMTSKELIKQILSKHPEVTRDQILESLEAEKEKTGGLIADETLLRLIAARHGIETIRHRVIRNLSISDLVAGLNDVTVAGRVVVVYPPRTFDGKRSGKVAHLLIADKDDTLNVVLWNDKVDMVESGELKAGQVARFYHGYTRKDREGKVELHISNKSQVEVNPRTVKPDEYPDLFKFATKISQITTAHNSIHLAGIIKEVLPASKFTRNDTSTGTVMRLKLADETGEIPVVVWDEKAEEFGKVIKVNAGLQLVNAKVKESGNGELEVHVNSYTHVELLESLDF
jgi:ssDNA-binding replication factor A large subunit